ncbi:pentapeptide repeat-containing protein [Furfurilactobacillus siliginis]|uniref:Pentapeptide repeat-containing protein n=1 Tax=Furfurilactobacillus siliginis TaxID=348151 RepID=A0A0R2LCJ8_9LACO|nr:pentapeptide repeat-containing protein [Furfurilactobacillus siliginis]KRN96391.1 pentapeptide repeat-containing protein [Furfurilactobacillus siliginis]GEK29313.1 hypothetical protein LSI01_16240 [Furfurilactobacillus siliginis]
MPDQPEIRDQTLSLDDVEPDTVYVNCTFTVSNQALHLMDVTFDHCIFEQTNFDDVDFTRVHWHHSQVPNASWQRSTWFECQLESLQLAGGDFSQAVLRGTTFSACKLTYANFSEMRAEHSRFLNCDLLESAFQAVTVKKGLDFAGSRITDADFVETQLAGFDWHEAEFEALRLDSRLVRGLIVSQYQAAQLIGMFGIEVK